MAKVPIGTSTEGPYMSSVIRTISYEIHAQELFVTFMSGRTYAYRDVPKGMYDEFLAAPSKGVFFNMAIRDHYPFRELKRR